MVDFCSCVLCLFFPRLLYYSLLSECTVQYIRLLRSDHDLELERKSNFRALVAVIGVMSHRRAQPRCPGRKAETLLEHIKGCLPN
jgi:hypothetical protein